MTRVTSNSKKRPLATQRGTQVSDVDHDQSPCKVPRMQQEKQQPSDMVPFLDQDWVKTVMEQGKLREFSLTESLNGAVISTAQHPVDIQAKSGNEAECFSAQCKSASSCSGDQVRFAAASDSDTDLRLAASLKTSVPVFQSDLPKTLQEAIVNVRQSIKRLSEVYSREMNSVKGQLAEKDLLIDQLRVKLRSRPSKNDSSFG